MHGQKRASNTKPIADKSNKNIRMIQQLYLYESQGAYELSIKHSET